MVGAGDDAVIPTSSDHLAALAFRGSTGAAGRYRPQRFDLRLTGTDEIADRLTYIHETHHASLNDSTAWGALLHVVARIPPAGGPDYEPLLDACRLIHESYATYASLSIVEAHLGLQPAALDAYPEYLPLQQRLARLVSVAGGPQRRYLLATAIARVCMQSPVLEHVAQHGLAGFRLSELRSVDTPDGRYRAIVRADGAMLAEAAAAGDRAAGLSLPQLTVIDGLDADEASRDEHDDMWGRWETAAYDVIASALRELGATPLEYNGHQQWTDVVLAGAEERWGHLGLKAAMPLAPVSDDRGIAEAMLAQVRHELVDPPYRARVLDVELDDIAELAAEHAAIGGQPVLIVDVRLADRLLDSYRWDPEGSLGRTERGPVVGIRLIGPSEHGGSEIVFVPIPTMESLVRIVERWAGRGPALATVTASCLIDLDWQREWWRPLGELLRTVMLIDIEPARLTKSWAASGEPVRMATISVQDTSAEWHAVALQVPGSDVLWLGIGDQITANFLRHSVSGAIAVQADTAFLTEWSEPLRIALTHLLATETFFDYAGLEGYV